MWLSLDEYEFLEILFKIGNAENLCMNERFLEYSNKVGSPPSIITTTTKTTKKCIITKIFERWLDLTIVSRNLQISILAKKVEHCNEINHTVINPIPDTSTK